MQRSVIALEVLRVFEPDVYQQLPTVKDMLTNFRNSGSQSDRAEEEGRRITEDIVNHASEATRPRVQEVLKQLFPRIEWVFGGSHYGAGVDEQWFRELRVCHPKVFDRYFHLTIPAGDIARAEIDRILSLVGDREGLVTEFRALNQRDLLGTALDRLEAYKENIDLQHAVPFITALFDIGDELPDEPGGLYSMAADMHALRIIHWYLIRESASGKRGRILKDAMKATKGLYLPVRKTGLEDAGRQNDPKACSITEASLRDLKNICVEKIRNAAKDGTLASHPKMLSFLYPWREWTSPKEPKQWVRGLMRSREDLLAFLVALLQRSQVWGLTDHVSRDEWSIRLENVEDFVPAAVIAKKISQLSPEGLTEQQQRAIHAFQQAQQQRQKGRTGGTNTQV